MLKINKKTEYALMVLKCLDEERSKNLTSSAKGLAENLNIPFDTVSKVLQKLKKAGVVTSAHGHQGGYKLFMNLDRLSYFDFHELIEGKVMGSDCVSKQCGHEPSCNITGPIKKLNDYMINYCKQMNLKELFEDSSYNLLQMMDNK